MNDLRQDIMTEEQAAEELQTTVKKIKYLTKTKQIPHKMLDRTNARYSRTLLEAHLQGRCKQPCCKSD